MTMNNVYLKTYEIKKFNRTSETIRSPIYDENEAEKERKTRENVLSVSDRYTIMEEINEEKNSYLEELFDAVEKLAVENEVKDDDDSELSEPLSNDELVFQLQEILSTEITEAIDDLTFIQLIQLNNEDREKGKDLFIKTVDKVLRNGVRVENINSAKEEVNGNIKYSTLNEEMKKVLYKLVDFSIVENSFFDAEKTMEARNEAASNVNTVIIRSGDIIVREGQFRSEEHTSALH